MFSDFRHALNEVY